MYFSIPLAAAVAIVVLVCLIFVGCSCAYVETRRRQLALKREISASTRHQEGVTLNRVPLEPAHPSVSPSDLESQWNKTTALPEEETSSTEMREKCKLSSSVVGTNDFFDDFDDMPSSAASLALQGRGNTGEHGDGDGTDMTALWERFREEERRRAGHAALGKTAAPNEQPLELGGRGVVGCQGERSGSEIALSATLRGHRPTLSALRVARFEIDPVKYREDKIYREGVETLKDGNSKLLHLRSSCSCRFHHSFSLSLSLSHRRSGGPVRV